MIKISNWLSRPLMIDIEGFHPHLVSPAEDNGHAVVAGVVRIQPAHYSALLALDPSDRRRRDLALAEVRADDGTREDEITPSLPSPLGDPIKIEARRQAIRGY